MPINVDRLGGALHSIDYPQDKIHYLMNGFTHGFALGVQPSPIYKSCKNHPTATSNYPVLIEKINKELRAGHWSGPYDIPPMDPLTVNPLGLVPKMTDDGRDLPILVPHDPDSYRMITDLHRSGVNDQILTQLAKIQYTKFDEVICRYLSKGRGCHLAKTDIKSAFRIIPVSPKDWKHLGARCGRFFFIDKCLPFGLATSCVIFEEVAKALEAIVRAHLQSQTLDHYLDDYIMCNLRICQTNQAIYTLVETAGYLGIPIAWEKTRWATTLIHFLGLDVNTVDQVIMIPNHKISALPCKLDHVLGSKTVTVKTLQSLAGTMSFYTKAKPGGRTFIRRIYDIIGSLPQRYHVNVSSEFKQDAKMWKKLIWDPHMATPFCEVTQVYAEDIGFYTDAAGGEDAGWGIYLQGEWGQGKLGAHFIREYQPSTA